VLTETFSSIALLWVSTIHPLPSSYLSNNIFSSYSTPPSDDSFCFICFRCQLKKISTEMIPSLESENALENVSLELRELCLMRRAIWFAYNDGESSVIDAKRLANKLSEFLRDLLCQKLMVIELGVSLEAAKKVQDNLIQEGYLEKTQVVLKSRKKRANKPKRTKIVIVRWVHFVSLKVDPKIEN
jgi:hypothetical protein